MKQAICILLLALVACSFALTCNPGIGLANQATYCTPQDPCLDVLPNLILDGIVSIDTPQFDGYVCSNSHHNDGVPQTVTINGMNRLYCQYYFETEDLLPLIIFLHPNGEDLTYPYTETNIRNHAASYNLNPAIETNGYVFVSVNALNRHWPIVNGSTGQDGSNFDYLFRDHSNEDTLFLDYIIDNLVNTLEVVDPRRIHLIGAANGGYFAQGYGILRSFTPTPGGNYVSSVAVYSAANPFGPIAGDGNCELAFYPTSTVPILVISRDCDVTDCGAVDDWVHNDLPNKVQDTFVRWILLNEDSHTVSACSSNCDAETAAINHASWPITWESDILDFLKFSVSVPLSPNPEGPVPQFPNGNFTFSDYFSTDPWTSFIEIPVTPSTVVYEEVSGVDVLLPTLALLAVMFFITY